MTNLDKISKPEVIAELLFRTSEYDRDFCPKEHTCEFGFEVEKENCLQCIKKWLESEVEE